MFRKIMEAALSTALMFVALLFVEAFVILTVGELQEPMPINGAQTAPPGPPSANRPGSES
jgi:hypothetical protein